MTLADSVSRTRIRKFLRTGLIYALIFIVASVLGNLWLSRNQAQGPAPPVQGQNLQGHWTRVDFHAQPRPVLLYFLADWCPICRAQNPVIKSIADDYPVVAIAMQSGELDNVRRYAGKVGLTMPVINDGDGSLSRRFGVNGVPATFIVDAQGDIRFSTRGYASGPGLRLRLWLAERDLL